LKGYKDETNNISYTYDSDGLRASKTVNGVKTVYQYVNSALYYQCTYTTSGAIDKELYFFYDSYGNLASVRCFTGGKEYVYYTATNMQGDVLGIYDSSGTNVASYEYDTWGNLISTTDTSPIGIAKNRVNKLVEVVSPRQSTNYIGNKMSNMLSNNPGTAGKIVTWVRRLFK